MCYHLFEGKYLHIFLKKFLEVLLLNVISYMKGKADIKIF